LILDETDRKINSKNLSSDDNYVCDHFFESNQLTQMLINASCDLLDNNQYKEAIDLLIDIIRNKDIFLDENMDDLINAHNYLALCYSRLGEFMDAEKVYIDGIRIRNSQTLLNNLAILYRTTGRYLESKNTFDKIDVDPKDINTYSYQILKKQKATINELIELENQMIQGFISMDLFKIKEQSLLNQYK
jgi:tetratricopeptide (TPR) repeat protein